MAKSCSNMELGLSKPQIRCCDTRALGLMTSDWCPVLRRKHMWVSYAHKSHSTLSILTVDGNWDAGLSGSRSSWLSKLKCFLAFREITANFMQLQQTKKAERRINRLLIFGEDLLSGINTQACLW